jgi:hypothetical protein
MLEVWISKQACTSARITPDGKMEIGLIHLIPAMTGALRIPFYAKFRKLSGLSNGFLAMKTALTWIVMKLIRHVSL